MKSRDNDASDKQKESAELARDVLQYAKDTLMVNMRYMQPALSRLRPKPYLGTMGTDGIYLYYCTSFLLSSYMKCPEMPTHIYLHSVLHCVFRHFYVTYVKNRRLWDLACDIAAEYSIPWSLSCIQAERRMEERTAFYDFESHVKYMTAEHLYRYLDSLKLSKSELEEYERIFAFDDHTPWYEKAEADRDETTDIYMSRYETTESEQKGTADVMAMEMKKEWQDVSKKVQINMEVMEQSPGKTGIGTGTNNLLLNLKAANRERYDYSGFLKKFATMGENMKINDDEFDYIFYTYGMDLYKNVPLIEPLEYKDEKKIQEFVIAIDVSGSVYGDPVSKFVTKTYNILTQRENFFNKVNIHIIFCDNEIKNDVKITSSHEMKEYIQNLSSYDIKGFGGTDFRPVFTYVDQLIRQGEFSNLKGMIYFTDGYGFYPEHKPDYEVAFVFATDDIDTQDVPPWAIKMVLDPVEIEEEF